MIINSIGQQTENLSFAASRNDSDSTTTPSSDSSLANFSLDHFVEENPTLERVLQGGASPSYSIHQQNEDELYQNQTAAITFVNQETANTTSAKAVLHLTEADLKKITPALLKQKVLLDPYSLEAEYRGFPVLAEAKWLNEYKEGHRRILYQRTPAVELFGWGIEERHWVVGVHVKEETDKKIIIEWNLLNNYDANTKQFIGDWENEKIKKMTGTVPPTDAIWVPYTQGSWNLDLDEGTLTYETASDPVGYVPSLEGAVVAFPNHIAKKMGLQGRFKVVS